MNTRLNIYLSPGQHEEIAALSAKRRVSKSSVIEGSGRVDALAGQRRYARSRFRATARPAYPARSSASNATWQSLSRRWHCSSDFGLRSPRHCPRARRLPPRQRGPSAYRDFVETLGRRLQRGNSLVREISLEICPEHRSNGVGSAVPSDPDIGAEDIADAQ
jgi:hypothetical protein